MTYRRGLLFVLPLAASLVLPASAQQDESPAPPPAQTQQQQAQQPAQPAQTQATPADQQARQPLQLESKEGFWGKLNPFARKKYVKRQLQPVVGRVNELDELTAANAKEIRDVDARTTEGIRLASLKANEADSHAVEAQSKADLAHQTALQASNKLETVAKAVDSVDQYQKISEVEIRFRPGHTVLSSHAKDALDQIATPLKDQKGYIIEVQGFSSGRGQAALANSQDLAESVVRYLVLEHEIPVYRIYTVGMGNAVLKVSENGKPRRTRGGRVEITLLRNGIADLASAQQTDQPQQMQPAGQSQPQSNSAQPTTPQMQPNSMQPAQSQPSSTQKPESDQPK